MEKRLQKQIRALVVFFMIAIAVSGITAFPVYTELQMMKDAGLMDCDCFRGNWLTTVYNAVADTQAKYPFLFYGYDWLAFAHLVIAALFYGVYKNPVRNKFIVDWGIFCCIGIVPLAIICSAIRSIPWQHTIVDCCFGIFGIIPLFICRKKILQLEKLQATFL